MVVESLQLRPPVVLARQAPRVLAVEIPAHKEKISGASSLALEPLRPCTIVGVMANTRTPHEANDVRDLDRGRTSEAQDLCRKRRVALSHGRGAWPIGIRRQKHGSTPGPVL
jgi:hypothetical protein